MIKINNVQTISFNWNARENTKIVNLGCIILLLVLLFSPLCASAQQNGTTLSVTKSATGFWERTIEYDWTVQKSVSPSSVELGLGASQSVNYTITTTKTAKAPIDKFGAVGQICVNNGGSVPTENLVVTDNIQAKVSSGMFQTIATVAVDTSARPVIGAGETYCYSYRAEFTPILNAVYRNEAKVAITNHSGYLPGGNKCSGPALCPFGPQYRVGFSLPSTFQTIYRDSNASVENTFTPLSGFSVAASGDGPWKVSAGGTIDFSAIITNSDATCASTFQLHNSVRLLEWDTLDQRNSGEDLGISTPSCSDNVFGGCTYTQGYWKNHEELWSVHELRLGNTSYSKSELLEILSTPPGTGKGANGLIQLAHQLIAAKLNTLKASDSAQGGQLFNSLALADVMIGDLIVPPVGSDYLAPSLTSALIQALSAFNEGGPNGDGDYDLDGVFDGPGHCL